MSDAEKLIWAGAFVAEFARERDFRHSYAGQGAGTIDDISGFSCAEVADVAVEKYREAINGPDREFLLPVKEQWR